MRVNKLLGALVAGSVALTPAAAMAAQPVGSVVTVNGDAFVSREGRLVRATPNMTVNAGDRVITRTGGSANLALNGCSTSVAGGEMKTIGNGSCGSVQTASFDRAATQTSDQSSLHGGIAGGTVVIALLAAVAVIVGIVIIVRNNDDRPTSP